MACVRAVVEWLNGNRGVGLALAREYAALEDWLFADVVRETTVYHPP